MPDDVWRLSERDERRFRRPMVNGVGFNLMGFTPRDETGRCFATLWVTLVLPVLPLARYYVGRGVTACPGDFTTLGRFRIYGRSRLRLTEVAWTLLACWVVVPGIVVVPIVIWLAKADALAEHITLFGVIGGFVCWLVGSILALSIGWDALYRDRWGRPRTVRFIDVPLDGRQPRRASGSYDET